MGIKIPSREETCAFTGHRPKSLPWGANELDERCERLKEGLYAAVERAYDLGFHHFVCGMARGADLYFCETVLAYRACHSDVTLEAAVPYVEQARWWPEEDRERYRRLLTLCDLETVVQVGYTADVYFRRNVYLVEHANRLIAAFNGNGWRSGTAATIRYAMHRDVEVDVVWVEK